VLDAHAANWPVFAPPQWPAFTPPLTLADGLASLGFSIAPQEFFDTITVEVGPYQGLIMKNAVDMA
jgi:hypothetical protein